MVRVVLGSHLLEARLHVVSVLVCVFSGRPASEVVENGWVDDTGVTGREPWTPELHCFNLIFSTRLADLQKTKQIPPTPWMTRMDPWCRHARLMSDSVFFFHSCSAFRTCAQQLTLLPDVRTAAARRACQPHNQTRPWNGSSRP